MCQRGKQITLEEVTINNAGRLFLEWLLFLRQTLVVNLSVGFEVVRAFHLCKDQIKRKNVHLALALAPKQRTLKIQSAILLTSTLTTARSQRSNLFKILNYP